MKFKVGDIVCLPGDEYDIDHHAIVKKICETYTKWLYVFFFDDKRVYEFYEDSMVFVPYNDFMDKIEDRLK